MKPPFSHGVFPVAKLLNRRWSLSRQTLKKPQHQRLHLKSIDADLGRQKSTPEMKGGSIKTIYKLLVYINYVANYI